MNGIAHMKALYLHAICACLLVSLFAGCRPKYPHIEYEGNPRDVVFGHVDFPVPVNVAITNPLYETYTRGVGVFDKYQDGVAGNWENADIYVYAFYSPSNLGGGPNDIDYSKRMDSEDDEKIYCLVDDADDEAKGHGKRAYINNDITSFLQWGGNNVPYYNSSYQQYRYKFFAYHIDDAADLMHGPERGRDYVAYNVEIDGTQDLMCGYATPTRKQLAALNAPSDKHILNNIEELAYSTTTGYRDIFPIFQLKHQLAFMKFFIKTDSIMNADGTKEIAPEANNLRIKNIIVKAPCNGKFVVAADDVNRLGVTFADEPKELYMPVRVKVDEEGNPITDEEGRRITVPSGEEGQLMAGDMYGFNPFIAPEAREKEVGAGFLLPPSDGYELVLECCQLGPDGDPVEPDSYVAKYRLEFEGNTFKAGHMYEVCIKVYGLQDIDFGLGEVTWKDGGSIDVGGEDDESKQE